MNYLVEAARLGQTTDYDKLTVDVWTNGSITPRDAVSLSAKLIRDHLNTFINLEDEHGLVNVICSTGVWSRYRRVARDAPALIIRGMLERSVEGVTNLLADRFEDLRMGVSHSSRDFR